MACESQVFAQEQQTPQSNWVSADAPCAKYDDLRKTELGDIGVKIDAAGPWAEAFRKALTFWNKVLDANFHEDSDLNSCAVRIIEGDSTILKPFIVARAQFTTWDSFYGKIAVSQELGKSLKSDELYVTAVHEFGHLLGLKHNRSSKSVMYYLDITGTEVLDYADLVYLRIGHKLRSNMDLVASIPVGDAPTEATTAPLPAEAERVSLKSRSEKFLSAIRHIKPHLPHWVLHPKLH